MQWFLFQYLHINMPNQVSGFNGVSKNLRGFLKPLETPLPTPLDNTISILQAGNPRESTQNRILIVY